MRGHAAAVTGTFAGSGFTGQTVNPFSNMGMAML
jgi:hypothetical protein